MDRRQRPICIRDSGIDHTKDWPFVTLSSFQEQSATVKQTSGALFVGMNPIVLQKDRAKWENYSVYNEEAQWYQEGLHYQDQLGLDVFDERPQVETDDPHLDLSTGVANRIFDLVDNSIKVVINPVEDQYLPAWQVSLQCGGHEEFYVHCAALTCTTVPATAQMSPVTERTGSTKTVQATQRMPSLPSRSTQ